MKIISNIFSVILLLVLFSGCGKDNFDAPESNWLVELLIRDRL